MLRSKSKAAPTLPRCMDFADVMHAVQKLGDIQQKRDNLARLLADSEEKRRKYESTGADIEMKADRILEGKPLKDEEIIPTRESLKTMRDDLAAFDRAIDKQRQNIKTCKRRRNTEACEQVFPQYRSLVSQFVQSLEAAARTAQEIRQLLDHLRDEGLLNTGVLPDHDNQWLGRLNDPNSKISICRREAGKSGLLD